MSDPKAKGITLSVDPDMVKSLTTNVGQDLIYISEDKVRICLMKHAANLEQKHAWIAPASLGASIIVTLVSTTFQKFAGLSADFWKAVFFVGLIVSIVWGCTAWLKRKRVKSVDELIDELRAGAEKRVIRRDADPSPPQTPEAPSARQRGRM